MHSRRNRFDRRQFHSSAAAGFLALGAAASQVDANERGDRLFAGAAETIATPAAKGTFLIGPMKPSTGVNDDLFARALVLAQGENRFAIVTLDYLGFDFEFTNVLLAAAAKAGKIPQDRVLLNCSHTHSAPLTAPWGPWREHRDEPHYRMLPAKVAEVVRRASENLRPATVHFRREPTQIGFNRRLFNGEKVVMAVNPQGAALPWVDVLQINRQGGESLAVLFSHAAHSVIVHEASTLISADYPGFAVRTLKKARGLETTWLFGQGFSGNVNGFPLKGGIDAAAAAGRELGQAVDRALDRTQQLHVRRGLVARSAVLDLPLQRPPSVKECRTLMQQEQRPDRRKRFAALLALAESGDQPTMRMPIRALALGELCLVAMAHEPFAEYHHWLNEHSPFAHTMALGYTNGLECYVGMRADYELGERGGYETSPRGAAFMFESRLPLAPECEELIKDGLKKLLADLHAQTK